MRRLWPSSLYGQILMVAALALLLAQAVNTTLIFFAYNMRATVEASSMLVARVANRVDRQRLLDNELSERQGRRGGRAPSITLVVGPAPVKVAGFHTQPELAERASEYLLAVDPGISSIRLAKGPIKALPVALQGGSTRQIFSRMGPPDDHQPPSEAMLLSMKLRDGNWVTASTPIRAGGPFPPIALLLQTLTLYLAVLIPLALVARRIARPLKALTDRVAHIGFTGDNPPMAPRGPSDVRELIEAFNGAEARLSSLLVEKDVMLGAIGHDLKTPLASLRVRIENVDNEDEREKMAATVHEMVTILDDILVLARLGKSAEDIQQTDLGALVETVIADMPDDPAIAFAAPGRVVVPVRPVLIRRALRNLVSNAVQYGGNAEIGIEKQAALIILSVEDSGPGIEADQIDKIFEPFARADSSRNRASGGSGLGLTIARAIARAHGGDVRLCNRPEGGVRAELILPL